MWFWLEPLSKEIETERIKREEENYGFARKLIAEWLESNCVEHNYPTYFSHLTNEEFPRSRREIKEEEDHKKVTKAIKLQKGKTYSIQF